MKIQMGKLSVSILCFACIVMINRALFAGSTSAITSGCSSSYESTLSAINSAQIGQGLKSKLLAHVNNAWRTYNSGKKNSIKIALQQLDVAIRQIDSPSNRAVPPETKNLLRSTIHSLSDCIEGSSPIETATLTVRVFLPSDTAANGILGPAPAGAIINVDEIEFGLTGSNGTATIQVPARTILVEVRLYPSAMGQATVTLTPNETKVVDITLEDGKEIAENSTLAIDQLKDSILDRTFTSLTLRFVKDDQSTVAIKQLDLVALVDPQGGASVYVTQMFTLQQDGTLILNDLTGFRDI